MRSPGALTRTVAARIRESAAPSRRPPLVRELLLLAALYLAYKFGRRAANGQFADAYDNAGRIWDLERAVHMPSEAAVQDLLLHSESLVRAINIYYATVHFPAILLFLAWMFWRRPGHYRWIRWVLTWLTGAGLVLHLLFPLAPPRLFGPTEMMDTSAVFGPAVYGKPEANSMANQFAAMPSLHVGWAVVIAVGLIVTSRSRLRWLWMLHPLVTVLAVVGTGHHYWMDGLVACALLAVILVVLRPPRALPHAGVAARRTTGARPSTAPAPVPEGARREENAPSARAAASRATGRFAP